MCFLIGHGEVNAAEEFLPLGGIRTECRLVSADMNCIVNVALCFGHGILLDPRPVADAKNELNPGEERPRPAYQAEEALDCSQTDFRCENSFVYCERQLPGSDR
jgi:hypothetical protein